MKKIKTIFKIYIVVFLILFSLCAYASGKIYTVGVENTDYYPHFSFDSEKQGFTRELLDFYAESIGVVFHYKPLPINRLFLEFTNGKLDFKYPDNPGWQKELKKKKRVIYSDPVVQLTSGIMVLPKNKGRNKAMFKTLGTVMGFTPAFLVDPITAKQVALIESLNVERLIQLALIGRVDGIDIEYSVAHYHLNRMNKKNLLVLDPDLPYVNYAFYLSTYKHDEVISGFNIFLKKNNDLILQLKEKYMIREAVIHKE